MKLEQTHIDQIRSAFEKMQSKEDLLHLLNEAKPLLYGDKTVSFELKQLTWYANPKLAKKRYSEFKIKKKSGTLRSIHAPVSGLKSLQKTLSLILQCVFEPHHAAMGFVRGKSIVDNAKLHAGRKYVYNIDLKDFFPSINQARIWKCLQLKPFNLNSKESKLAFKEEDLSLTIYTGTNQRSVIAKEKEFATVHYDGYSFKGGFHKVNLMKDGYLFYKVNVRSSSTKSGNIVIFKGKSKYDNIKGIVEDEYQLNINLFTEAINHQLRITKMDSSLNIASMIASICCTEMEVERKNEAGEWVIVKSNVLPQGAPTSPVITNIVCQRLDFILTGVAKRFGLKYSRYADDITFSSSHNVYRPDGDFLKELHRAIEEQGFHIKESKTRLQKEGHRQEVTGLLINEKVNVQKRYIKQLRMWLYYWEKYGYERAYGFFLQQYLADKGNIVKGKPDMASVIGGKLDFLKMVKGADNELYLKLKGRFDALTGYCNPINKVLDVWEKEGIEVAMKKFYAKNDILLGKEVKSLDEVKALNSFEEEFDISDLIDSDLIDSDLDSEDQFLYIDDDFIYEPDDED